MISSLNKDTTLCISLASHPGNFGTRFHNFLYHELQLNFIYKAFSTTDIESAVRGVRALGIRGCAISMPFKESCIPFLDELTPSVKAIDSVNTIVNTNGRLSAYNTDYIAIYKLIKQNAISPTTTFALKGSGGMAKAVACALRDLGFKNGYIVARNKEKGSKLAESCGFKWCTSLNNDAPEMLINATPVGMKGSNLDTMLAFDNKHIERANIVFDVVALPSQTPLVMASLKKGKTTILGSDVFAIQALEQFKLYTGVEPTQEQFTKAAAYSRTAD